MNLKKIISCLMAVIMLFSVVPVSAVSDITPPVITEVTFNSQNVQTNDRYVYFTIKGYDSDGSQLSADKSHIDYYVPNCMMEQEGEGLPAEEIIDHGDGTYTFKFGIRETWYGPYFVRGLFISDEYGNVTYIDVEDENGNSLYTGYIDAPISKDFSATNITINGSTNDFNASLTDTLLNCPFTFSADITTGNASIPNGANLNVVYKNADNFRMEFWVNYNNGTITCISDIGYMVDEGTYVLENIIYDNEFLAMNTTAPNIIVTKSNTDQSAPVVEDVWLTVNGNKEEGFIAQKGTDKVKVYVKVSDASDIERVEVNLQTAHSSYENPQTLRLDAVDLSNGIFATEVPLDLYNATVWYVDDVYAYDVYYNMEPERGISPYYILKDEEGNTTIPTITFSGIQFDFGIDSDWLLFENPITIEGITSINDILSEIGETLKPVNVPAGRTFMGWYIGNMDTVIGGSTPTSAAEKMFALKRGGIIIYLLHLNMIRMS